MNTQTTAGRSLDDLIEEFISWKRISRPGVVGNYRLWLRRLSVHLESKSVNLDAGHIVSFLSSLEGQYKPNTLSLASSSIKSFLKYCEIAGYNAPKSALIQSRKVYAEPHRAVNEGDYRKILSGIIPSAFHSIRDSMLIRILWDTGVRVSELVALNVEDIDITGRQALIRTRKTSDHRVIFWSIETNELLQNYLTEVELLTCRKGRGPLFPGIARSGLATDRISTRTVERMICIRSTKVGLEGIKPHGFRHGWAHHRRAQGAPLSFIQHGLGHRNAISTFIYQQYEPTELRIEAKKYLN